MLWRWCNREISSGKKPRKPWLSRPLLRRNTKSLNIERNPSMRNINRRGICQWECYSYVCVRMCECVVWKELFYLRSRSRTYSPSMTHLLLDLSNWQSTPLHGCCCGKHGSPFHPKRRGSPSARFNDCNAFTEKETKNGVSIKSKCNFL